MPAGKMLAGVPVLPQFQLGKLPVESVEFISAEVTHK
jgi:hypothetical protein